MEFDMRKWCLIFSLLLTACAPIVIQPSAPTPPAAPTRSIAPTPMPADAPIDLTPYQAAMRSDFVKDLDQFATATQYQIDLTIAPDLAAYTATQRVRYTNTAARPLDAVYFRLFPNTSSYGGKLTMNTLKLNGVNVKPISELDNSALRIPIEPPLPIGAVADFELAYVTRVPTSAVTSGYNQFGLFNGILALPNFYPQIPAYDAEGWNIEVAPGMGDAVYSDSALYQVNILAPKAQVVVTSGTCESQAAPAGQQSQRCVSGPMRDFMIALSADFQVASQIVDGIKINSYYLKKDVEAGQRGLDIIVQSVKSYEKRIGLYPFNELDLVETPTTAGGIEYPGLIVVADDLYKANATFQEGATAHEAAHQWWYSLVGNDQVDDPWLDESLTQFTTALYFLDAYGQSGYDGYVKQDLQQRYDRVKGTVDDMRGDLPVAAYSDQQYSAIVYGKDALFFDAVRQQLGDAKTNAWLQTYFKANRYGVVHEPELLKAIETQLDAKTVEELMQKWIRTPE
jgi:aminopeptidase N